MGIKTFTKDFLYYASIGHKSKSVDPKSYSNLLGFRKGVSLINAEKIKSSFFTASNFVELLISNTNSSILFINLDEDSNDVTSLCALKALQPFLIKGWSSGTFTNTVSKYKIGAIFLLSARNHGFILQEASKLNIPIIALVDSDSSSNLVSFPIWLNDDSVDLHREISVAISLSILRSSLLTYGLHCVEEK
jgi:ribosomal protein S2